MYVWELGASYIRDLTVKFESDFFSKDVIKNVAHFDQASPCANETFHSCPHGPLARYGNLRVAHAPGMPGSFPPPPRVSDPDMHHGTCVTHDGITN